MKTESQKATKKKKKKVYDKYQQETSFFLFAHHISNILRVQVSLVLIDRTLHIIIYIFQRINYIPVFLML